MPSHAALARLRSGTCVVWVLAGAVAVVPAARAQSLERRVVEAREGEVRLAYATRSEVCGDGRDVVAFGGTLFVYPNVESHGRWSGVRCEPGPARVALTVRGGVVSGVRTRVGGVWAPREQSDGAVIDLGVVPAGAAAAYLVALGERLDGRPARQALLAAVAADSADVSPGLLRLARNASLGRSTRQQATRWLGELGDASLVGALEQLARGDEDGSGVGGAAMYALGRLPDDAGVLSLITFARSGAPDRVRKDAVFWLGQSEHRRAREAVRALVQDAAASDELRAHAIFSLGHGDATTGDDLAFLRRLFPSLAGRRLQDQVLMSLAQRGGEGGRRWALDRARDPALSSETRRQALFWAQQGGVSTADLVATYDALDDRKLKEHGLFVLSQRDDPVARDKLLTVARSGADRDLRRTALFWLTQKKDPRAERLIGELLGK